ncbi:hypothetical protein CLAFUW4_07119 [Fulvia fulva]|uniref:Uncharacterized protein n=1 Tax=Passalora fulva TaxID=5499 RepID=A0A9Q8PA02_PASFU|nr:uncharacterized protein CLAFUR5_07253 [Fulvia fulva]KAK4621751.1 hypothetical protein CLAFUR4_07128 [Fulvia fulva]KAK4623192.1 hypothetical protein CLAFUR0_07126 [Fulvia fulva]UJO18617.1 hypothetical protein CLAFUR5_07253 [Fulvia fulva]WPV16430.1 hypothetical protein CLAFUW4_07119 [Fulvia fulva]WPV31034.1 hypothetical protein CLAFUW7_07120 [Fulvia fulva]
MPPTAQRTIYLERADAESGDFEGGQEVDDDGRGRGGQDVEETATSATSAVSGRPRGDSKIQANDVASTDQNGKTVIPRHHARNWGMERNSKIDNIEALTKSASDEGSTATNSNLAIRHWTLEREAKYQAQKLRREEPPSISTIGTYRLIGLAPVETLDGTTVERGIVSMFSSTEVPTAVGFSTVATTAQASHARFTYAPATTVENHQTTIRGPPALAATSSVSQGERRIETHLPTSYVLSAYGLLVLLLVLWSVAALLYAVNFPPKFLLRQKATLKHGKKQYAKVPEDTSETGHVNQEIGSAAFTTSSDTPSLETPCLRTRRQKSQQHTDIEAIGLGIELADLAPRRQRSFINMTNNSLPGPPRSASSSRTAPLPPRSHCRHTPIIVPNHIPDIENGLTVTKHDYNSTYLSPYRSSPYASSDDSPPGSGSSSRSASPHRVLKRVGDGIEYLADKAVKMMHDQMKEDPEEDLVLPVRDCERERRGDGLKKRY